jgi:hypothetical protein
MKRIFLLAALYSTTLVQANPAGNANANPEQALLQAVKEVQAQQALIAENQTKIDQQIAALTETLRLARIYSSRSGN